jgi:alkylation response protein AidB-like acyl-CoA dehydrogenase
VLLRLGQLAASAEGAAALARRAARAAANELSPKASTRFNAEALAAIARVNAREAALTVATEGMRWIAGANAGDEEQVATLAAGLRLVPIQLAQGGLLADMDAVADAIYGRS